MFNMSQVPKKLLVACVLLLSLQLTLGGAVQRANEDCIVGQFCGHKLSCNKFYICVRDFTNPSVTYRIIKDCPPGMNFNGCFCEASHICVQ